MRSFNIRKELWVANHSPRVTQDRCNRLQFTVLGTHVTIWRPLENAPDALVG